MFKSAVAVVLSVTVGVALAGCGNYALGGYAQASAVDSAIVGSWISPDDVMPDARLNFADDGHFMASGFPGDLICETNGIRGKTGLVDAEGTWAMGVEDERDGGSTVNIFWNPIDSSVGEPCERSFAVQENEGELLLSIRDAYTEGLVIFQRESGQPET